MAPPEKVKEKESKKRAQEGGDIRLLTSCLRHKRVRHELTKGGNFDEDSMEVR